MSIYDYKKINAFTSKSSRGNPAACLYLQKDDMLSEADMLNIAKEHKGFVSEVVYCHSIDAISYRLRYFSSECEVEFCGHGTIACMYDLIKNSKFLSGLSEITIVTNRGELTVYNQVLDHDAIYISAPSKVEYYVKFNSNDVASYLGIESYQINDLFEIKCIDAGLRTLIVPIVDLSTVLNIHPDEHSLKTFCLMNNIDIILIFTPEASSSSNKVRTRVFAPKFGYLEDPATGSGNSALGYYMLQNGLWDGDPISIEQNAEASSFNIVRMKTHCGKILFGGRATTMIEGHYHV